MSLTSKSRLAIQRREETDLKSQAEIVLLPLADAVYNSDWLEKDDIETAGER